MAGQDFSSMARLSKVGDRINDFKRYLTNSLEPWLLILDNANNPSLDISQSFPVENKGTIIVASRNLECRCHATVESRELREITSEEAINLLLRSGDLHSEDQTLRGLTKPIVETLGYLALVVNHADTSIRQRICSLEDYLRTYTRHHKRLLSSQPIQAGSEYKYTIYTTWEISVESIKKLVKNAQDGIAANALEILTVFGFCDFDDIMFRSEWDNFTHTEGYSWWESNLLGIIRDRRPSNWDSLLFNEAIQILWSYSLIHVSGSNNRISLHPLRHCIGTRQIDDFFQEDDAAWVRVQISSTSLDAYSYPRWKDGLTLSERALEYSRRLLGDECYSTCRLSCQRAVFLNRTSQYQNVSDLLSVQLDVFIRLAGPADPLALRMMNELTFAYRRLGREPAALELVQKHLALYEKSLDGRDDVHLEALERVALGFSDMGRHVESVDLFEKALARRKEASNEEDGNILNLEYHLACGYSELGKHQAALKLLERTLKVSSAYGDGDPVTLERMVYATAYAYG